MCAAIQHGISTINLWKRCQVSYLQELKDEANLILQIPALMCKDVPGTLCARILFLGKKKKEVILKPSQAMSSREKVRSTSEQTLCKRHETWEEERSILSLGLAWRRSLPMRRIQIDDLDKTKHRIK